MFRFIVLSVLLVGSFAAPPSQDGRIVGGLTAKIKSFPYLVSIQLGDNHICGGTILSKRHVLTAASCVIGKNIKDLGVRAGSTNYEKGGQFVRVLTYLPNSYNPTTHDNNIAVIIVANDLIYNENIRPVILPRENEVAQAKLSAVTSGWGATSEGGGVQKNLMYAYLQTITRDDCAKRYQGKATITNSMMCAFQSGKGPCDHDVGSPLVFEGKLIGVVSWAIGCGHNSYPSVYADVGYYRYWIGSVAGV